MKKLTITQFNQRFPNNDVCLDYIFNLKYGHLTECPECKAKFNYSRVKERRAYQCSNCRNQVYPTAGTIFHQSTTPLTYWFLAIYLHTICKNGVAAKELERQLNVCYKTALRMAHQIKILMSDKINEKFFGEVVADESYFGGENRNRHRSKRKKLGGGYLSKTAVFGIMDTKGEKIYTTVMHTEQINGLVLKPLIKKMVEKDSTLVTDYFGAYRGLNKDYRHIRLNHSDNEFARDGFSSNRAENFWSGLKRQIKGTHISVSPKHLQKYVSENSFRYVNRDKQERMLDIILNRL